MNTITEIEISKLQHHPQNPRKDLGDLTELADSIKASGIMQNLTVVPDGDDYLVVIGNRRMEAAKLAGLETVPCAIVEMSAAEQLSTMMVENMQRSDLTIFEQAQGFQLMMDMGDTVDGIAEKTGFSKSTVRRRVKLMELDQDKLKKVSTERQISMVDIERLNKVSDIGTRNKLLSQIGTERFNYEVNAAIENERRAIRLAAAEKMLADNGCKHFKKNSDVIFAGTFYITCDDMDKEKQNIIKKFGKIGTLYYEPTINGTIFFYRKKAGTDSAEAEKQARERKRIAHCRDIVKRTNHRLWLKRLTFIRNYKESAAKECVAVTAKYLAVNHAAPYWQNSSRIDLRLIMGIAEEADYETFCARIGMEADAAPFRLMLWTAYERLGDLYDESGYIDLDVYGAPYYKKWDNRKNLDELYDFLLAIGYEMDEEEKRLMDGTSPLYDSDNPVWRMDDEKKVVKIDELELNVRTYNALKRAGINDSEQLIAAAADGSLFRHVNNQYDELRKHVAEFGITLPEMPKDEDPGETGENGEESGNDES